VHAQRKPGQPAVAAVPCARTYHPVRGDSAVVFTKPRYLAAGATRQEQRQADFDVVEAIAGAVELHAPHLVCAYLWLHAIHHAAPRFRRGALTTAVRDAHLRTHHSFVDPALESDTDVEITRTLAWLAHCGFVCAEGDTVEYDRDRVLHCPGLDTNYRKENPVKFHANQMMHIRDAVASLERSVLGAAVFSCAAVA